MQPRYSPASALFLGLAACMIAPLVYLGLQGPGSADAANFLGAILLPLSTVSLLISLGVSARAIHRGIRSAAQLLIAAAALALLLSPILLAALAGTPAG